MPAPETGFQQRLDTLSAVFTKVSDQKLIEHSIQASNGNWNDAIASLKGKVSDITLETITLARKLPDWSGDDVPVAKALATSPSVTSLRKSPLRIQIFVPASPELSAAGLQSSYQVCLHRLQAGGCLQWRRGASEETPKEHDPD